MKWLLTDIKEYLGGVKEKSEKAAEAAIITLIINLVLIAVKIVPGLVDKIKDFIVNLGQTEWTEEKLLELVADIKPPDEY